MAIKALNCLVISCKFACPVDGVRRRAKEVPYKLNSGHVPRCSQEVECLVLHKKARDIQWCGV